MSNNDWLITELRHNTKSLFDFFLREASEENINHNLINFLPSDFFDELTSLKRKRRDVYSEIGELTYQELRYFYSELNKTMISAGMSVNYVSFINNISELKRKTGWSETSINFVKDNKRIINEQANLFNISPVAIAGVVAWEREENPRGWLSDIIYQNFLADRGWISDESGIGYGSIHLNIAQEIEQNSSIPASRDQIERSQRLRDPQWAIQYIANILNNAAEDYQNIANINVRNQPDILATLYHIGRVPELARKRNEIINQWKANNYAGDYPAPQPDEMGIWINENINNINYLLGN